MKKILIVEDDKDIREMMVMALKTENYICTCASDGRAAFDLIDAEKFDLLLLDIMLPEFDGYEVMSYSKPKGIPTIFITAKKEVEDRIKGLNLGADDYIIKPFDIMEMLARVKAVLRRCSKTEEILRYGDIKMDLCSRNVTKGTDEVPLTMKEFNLFEMLLRNVDIAVYREHLFEIVWEEPYDSSSRTLDLHIQKIRKKLDLHENIKTVHKIGYKLVHYES